MTTSYSREVHHCSPRVFFVRFAICASFGHCDCGRSLNVSYILALFRLKVHQLQHVTRCGILHRTPGRRIVQILVSSSFILALRRLLGLAIVAILIVSSYWHCDMFLTFLSRLGKLTKCSIILDVKDCIVPPWDVASQTLVSSSLILRFVQIFDTSIMAILSVFLASLLFSLKVSSI